MLFRVLKCWDAEDLFTYGPLLAKLLQTDAAVSNPLNLADGIVMTMLFPGVAAGDMDMICQNTVTFLDLLLVASKTHEGTPLGRQCMIQCMGWTGLWFDFTIGRELEKNPKFDPGDMFGEKGSLIDKVTLRTIMNQITETLRIPSRMRSYYFFARMQCAAPLVLLG